MPTLNVVTCLGAALEDFLHILLPAIGECMAAQLSSTYLSSIVELCSIVHAMCAWACDVPWACEASLQFRGLLSARSGLRDAVVRGSPGGPHGGPADHVDLL